MDVVVALFVYWLNWLVFDCRYALLGFGFLLGLFVLGWDVWVWVNVYICVSGLVVVTLSFCFGCYLSCGYFALVLVGELVCLLMFEFWLIV